MEFIFQTDAMPAWFWSGVTLAMGLITGSFINVVIARLPHDQSVVRPASRCPSCEKQIAWYDNVPVISYLILRGKCRNCRSRISIRYPIVEILVATLFLAAEVKYGFSWLLFVRDLPFVAGLVAITFIDLDHRIIPDRTQSRGRLVIGLRPAWLRDRSVRSLKFFPDRPGVRFRCFSISSHGSISC